MSSLLAGGALLAAVTVAARLTRKPTATEARAIIEERFWFRAPTTVGAIETNEAVDIWGERGAPHTKKRYDYAIAQSYARCDEMSGEMALLCQGTTAGMEVIGEVVDKLDDAYNKIKGWF